MLLLSSLNSSLLGASNGGFLRNKTFLKHKHPPQRRIFFIKKSFYEQYI